jgi:hypothetical protein
MSRHPLYIPGFHPVLAGYRVFDPVIKPVFNNLPTGSLFSFDIIEFPKSNNLLG